MNAKHTPGPWEVNHGSVIAKNSIGVFSIEICDPSGGVNGIGKLLPIDEREANAALIAAAPDLLAALEAICSDHDFCGDEWGNRRNAWIETVRAAIAKATGGQS